MPFHHVIKNFVIQGGGGLNRMGDAEDWTLKRKSDGHLASRYIYMNMILIFQFLPKNY